MIIHNIIINILSIILFFIILYTIIFSSIYNKNIKVNEILNTNNNIIENFSEEFSEKENKILNTIKLWRSINNNAKFKFIFLKNVNGIQNLEAIKIHPDYQIKLYEKYNPEKNSKNILLVTEWMFNLQLDLSLYNKLNFIDNTKNWEETNIIPENWVLDEIEKIVLIHKLASNDYLLLLSNNKLNEYGYDRMSIIANKFSNLNNNNNDENKILEYKKETLEKIFDGCDIDKNGIINNNKEFKHLIMSMTNIFDKDEENLVKKIAEDFKLNNIEKKNIENLWNELFELFYNNNKDYLIKENFIKDNIDKSLEVLGSAIIYLEKNRLIFIEYDTKQIKVDNNISKLDDLEYLELIVNSIINQKKQSDKYDNDKKEYNFKVDYNINTSKLYDIVNNTENQYNLAVKRWKKYFENDLEKDFLKNNDIDSLISTTSYNIINMIKNGYGLHVNDIIWILKYEKNIGEKILDFLIYLLETEINTEKNNLNLDLNKIKIIYKTWCKSKLSEEILFTEISYPLSKNNKNNKLKLFWPIFSRNDIYDINEIELVDNINNDDKCHNYLCINEDETKRVNGFNCMFLDNK